MTDLYFRLFSGHTQVNAADMRAFPFPPEVQLRQLGREAGTPTLSQVQIDDLMDKFMQKPGGRKRDDPVARIKKVEDAKRILRELGFPAEQSNERSALVLLALLGIKARGSWRKATAPLLGITEIMDYFAEHFGKRYAPNTRETIRRRTVHQFLDAGLVSRNPDDPSRPVNSGKTVYQVVPEALAMLRTFSTPGWQEAKRLYLANAPILRDV